MTEKMVSPLSIYKSPESFCGVIVAGNKNRQLDYPVIVFNMMKRLFPDFPEKLAKNMKEYIVKTKDGRPAILFGKDSVNIYEIPDKIYGEIKSFL